MSTSHSNITSKGWPEAAPAPIRFWRKVQLSGPNGCWLWMGSASPLGYGAFWDGAKRTGSHRYAYELLRGSIPPKHDIDHLCRNPRCVNPDHLEPVTHRENVMRGVSSGARAVRSGTCHKGHPLSGDNLITYAGKPDRWCRACRDERNRKRYPNAVRAVGAVLLAVSLVLFSAGSSEARAQPKDTTQAVYEILRDRGSPLADEAYTVVAFRRYQGPEFGMLEFYAVVWAETNLARDGFWAATYNAGCIRGGSSGSLWRDLRVGTWGSGFNVYATPRDGQRALIRLLWDRGYMPLLRAHDWRGFTRRYWGGDYYTHAAHREEYIRDLAAAYRLLVQDGRARGLAAVHLE